MSARAPTANRRCAACGSSQCRRPWARAATGVAPRSRFATRAHAVQGSAFVRRLGERRRDPFWRRYRHQTHHQPGTGQLHPLVPIARALDDAGHAVAVCSAPSFRSEVEAFGLTHIDAGLDGLTSDQSTWGAFPPMPPPGPEFAKIALDLAAEPIGGWLTSPRHWCGPVRRVARPPGSTRKSARDRAPSLRHGCKRNRHPSTTPTTTAPSPPHGSPPPPPRGRCTRLHRQRSTVTREPSRTRARTTCSREPQSVPTRIALRQRRC